jgi:hypothetical protein
MSLIKLSQQPVQNLSNNMPTRQLITVGLMMITTNLFAHSEDTKKLSPPLVKQILNIPLDNWQIINDGVMGGLSAGKMMLNADTVIFHGSVSIENNGGFSGVYQAIPTPSEFHQYIQITIQGDGNRYQLRTRSKEAEYNIAYKVDFDTQANTLQTLTFDLADFQATFRGRLVENAPKLRALAISHIGFLIAAKQPINFSLLIKEVKLM